MSNELLIYLNLFSAFYYGALIVYISLNKNTFTGRSSLIGLLIVNLYALINNSLILSGLILEVSFFYWFGFIFISLVGFFVRMHIYNLLKKRVKLDLVNISVVVLWILSAFYAAHYYMSSEDQKVLYFSQILEGEFPEQFVMMNNVFMAIMSIYFIDAAFVVFKKPEKSQKSFSNLFAESRKYVRKFWLMTIGIYVVLMIFTPFLSEKIIEYAGIPIGMNVLFFFIIINLKQYSTNYRFDLEPAVISADSVYSKELLDRIEKTIVNDELFLNPNFTISQLAEQLNCSKNIASQTINRGLKVGFNDYLNSLRIEFSKSLLTKVNLENETIEGIGYQSGFNSKASFYRAFKKFTSNSPTEFIKIK